MTDYKKNKSLSQKNSDHMYSYAWPVENKEISCNQGVCFIDLDLSGVIDIRDYLEKVCTELKFNENQIFEICLIADELVANAIISTNKARNTEYIILRWKFNGSTFKINVLDYGGGLDLKEMLCQIPQGDNLDEFTIDLKRYNADAQVVKSKGKLVQHSNLGRGLTIVTSLADTFGIKYHEGNGKTSRMNSKNVVGSVISITYEIA